MVNMYNLWRQMCLAFEIKKLVKPWFAYQRFYLESFNVQVEILKENVYGVLKQAHEAY